MGIINDYVDDANQRRAERRAWVSKKVHAEVNCAPLARGIAARAEQCRRVKQSRLIVTAHTNGCARSLHGPKYFFREWGSFRRAGICSKKRTAHAQVKNEARNRSHINIQNRGRGSRARFQPALDLFTLRNRRKPATRAKSVMGKTRVYFFEPLQAFPRARFPDPYGLVGRLKRLAVS